MSEEQKKSAVAPILSISGALADLDGVHEALGIDYHHSAAESVRRLQKELFDLKQRAGLCVCPPQCTDEACAHCIADAPSIFEEVTRLEAALKISRELCDCYHAGIRRLLGIKNIV